MIYMIMFDIYLRNEIQQYIFEYYKQKHREKYRDLIEEYHQKVNITYSEIIKVERYYFQEEYFNYRYNHNYSLIYSLKRAWFSVGYLPKNYFYYQWITSKNINQFHIKDQNLYKLYNSLPQHLRDDIDNYLENYYRKKHQKKYKNVIEEYHRKVNVTYSEVRREEKFYFQGELFNYRNYRNVTGIYSFGDLFRPVGYLPKNY